MSLGDLGLSEADLSPRLKLVNLLPSALLIATVGALVLSGAPQHAPSLDALQRITEPLGWTTGVIAAVGAAVLGLMLQPLELASIRLLEGYWRANGPLAGLGKFGFWLQKRRRSQLEWVRQRLKYDDAALASQADDVLRSSFPMELSLLPTTLGNRLRAMEERAGRPYGLNIIVTWPRLYFILPEDALRKVNEYRNQLDISSRLCITFGLAGVITAVLLLRFGWWLMLPTTFFALSWFAYRSAVEAASSYGVAVTAAIDVYRLKLLQALRTRMPQNSDEERTVNYALTEYWERRGGTPPTVEYSLTDTDVGLRHGPDQG